MVTIRVVKMKTLSAILEAILVYILFNSSNLVCKCARLRVCVVCANILY